MPAQQKKVQKDRFVYKPVLDALIFCLAILGTLVVIHLWIQDSRGFDQGCWGFNPPASGEEQTFDCEAVVGSPGGKILGIPNTLFGLLFYLSVAASGVALLYTRFRTTARLKAGRAVLIGVAFLYALYLGAYQHFVLHEYCALCLTSAAIVLLMAVITAVDLARPVPITRSSRSNQPTETSMTRLYTILPIVAMLLAGADFLYFNALGRPVQAQSATTLADEECYYDAEAQPFEDYASLIKPSDPVKGNPDAKVVVIEFFDPNCPHCATLSPIMSQVIEQHEDDAFFVFKPFPISQFSVDQVQALYAANEAGKFFEMMEAQFKAQKRGGLSTVEIKAIFDEIGLTGEEMIERIASGRYQTAVQDDYIRIRNAGVSRFPTVWINGRRVGVRSAECIGRLIEEAGA